MKRIKDLGSFLRSTFSRRKRRISPRRQSEERTDAPKNGRLTVAVGISLLFMVLLGVINIRLIQNPSIADKAFKPIFSSKAEPGGKPSGAPVKESAGEKTCTSPTEITFWRNLKSQDETAVCQEDVPRGTASEAEPAGAEQQVNRASDKADGKKDSAKLPQTVRTSGSSDQHPPNSIGVRGGHGEKTYTVQVGAFSHPAIAQEWAQKWKARGYDVALKPVARPNTGVIYRLYLGSFTSEKTADDLVKHLKSKEGINALRLLVRDWGGASH